MRVRDLRWFVLTQVPGQAICVQAMRWKGGRQRRAGAPVYAITLAFARELMRLRWRRGPLHRLAPHLLSDIPYVLELWVPAEMLALAAQQLSLDPRARRVG